MYEKWIGAQRGDVAMVLLSAAVVYAMILVYTRLVGLRSFSKMSSGDFAMTVAIGSLFGSTVSSPDPTLFLGLFALALLFAGQWLFALLRHRIPRFSQIVDNEPLLLMAGSEFLDDNLRKAKVTRADIFGKLREANAHNYEQVLAVVFETTGDISVLHSNVQDTYIHPDFVDGVLDHRRLEGTQSLLSNHKQLSKVN